MLYFWLTVTTNHGDVIYVYFQVRDKTQWLNGETENEAFIQLGIPNKLVLNFFSCPRLVQSYTEIIAKVYFNWI